MRIVNIDMKKIAERILNDYSGNVQPNGDPIVITKETRLHRFSVSKDKEVIEPDKLHILVDGGGGFSAIIDPDSARAVKRHGHLSEFTQALSCVVTSHPNDNRPIAGDRRLFIEKLGYAIAEDPDQPGWWVWTSPNDGCTSSFTDAGTALESAWVDAIGQTMAINNLSSDQWDALSFDAQRIEVTVALSGEPPNLLDLGMDTQMQWLGYVRAFHPGIGPQEAQGQAVRQFNESGGVMPQGTATSDQSSAAAHE